MRRGRMKQILLFVLGSLLSIFLGLFLWKKYAPTELDKTEKDLQKEADKLEKEITPERIVYLDNAVFDCKQAMSGPTTWENELLVALETPENQQEFDYFISRFGIYRGYNLREWVTSEVSDYWTDRANTYYRIMKIDYQF